MKFQNPSMLPLYLEQTDGRTTRNQYRICPVNFFEDGGIIRYGHGKQEANLSIQFPRNLIKYKYLRIPDPGKII